ncbi:hypothetical protein PGT21_016011 [Puccinia graminis f. sp. tritici]|uniref:Uncharacterized protein n=1 Tax=Puccinia graminis f. sp. tritici TaxID=56615 RepID=A0A5B0LYM0_PUCGR|nr:hypothetical protein PGTUg99_036059 [Puccinia graminis f. sp. tritici]KAA1104243.1 hypothetical protein PGT21_016011 [Puccinia graminis f. sp. tritici]
MANDEGAGPASVRLSLRLHMPTTTDQTAGAEDRSTKQESTELIIEPVASSSSTGGPIPLSELAKTLARVRVQSNRTLTALINSYGSFESAKEKKLADHLRTASSTTQTESEEDEDEEGEDED